MTRTIPAAALIRTNTPTPLPAAHDRSGVASISGAAARHWRTGPSPGRPSTNETRASDRVGDGREHFADIGAKQADAADDHNRDESGDEGIFQRGHPPLVSNHPFERAEHDNLRFVSPMPRTVGEHGHVPRNNPYPHTVSCGMLTKA